MRDLQKIYEECLLEQIQSLNIPVGNIIGISWVEMNNNWGLCVEKMNLK